ncbi:unnamed protein product [Lactuca saligna]|uniref:RBR-type E3 ubiquitin transferase n=1 Tax=Lactuca saligna TaxID=75948 RepID=A0AA35V9U0_LACSI|nr:unnamed protein product [Lactuca saligna]
MSKFVSCLKAKPRKKRISRKNMASSSTSAINHIIDVDKIIDLDDFNLSAPHDDGDKMFMMSDEKYTQELQLQEALTPSASKTNVSSSSQKVASSSSLHERICGICLDSKALPEIFSNAKVCGHLFCSACISQYVSVKIKENIAKVKCPDPMCKGLIGPEVCRDIVPKEVLERWEDALCESMIMATQKFYCPFKDCSAMLVDDGGVAVTSALMPKLQQIVLCTV